MHTYRDVPAKVRVSGEIIAENVTFEEFMETDYDGQHVEWAYGLVIKMATIDRFHDAIVAFLRMMFSAYLELLGGGVVIGDPLIMKPSPDLPGRAPDLQVLLPENTHKLKQNRVIGAADLVVEVVSKGSQRTDRVEKYSEYEQGGVPEYWLIDFRRKEAQFYQRGGTGLFELIEPDENGVYHSKVLPRLTIKVDLLWQDPLPTISRVVDMVRAMFVEKP
jgi:Uma2 family endonuclease